MSSDISGSIFTITIEVSSSISGTKKMRYNFDFGGVVDNLLHYFGFDIMVNTKNEDFKINNKANILPSNFNDITLIKNVLKSKMRFLPKNLTTNERNKLKKVIDNNLKITFHPEDEQRILQFTIQLRKK